MKPTSEQIKDFIRENLEVVIEYSVSHGPELNQRVGLRFKGDDEVFAEDIVVIPDMDDH